MGKILTGFVNSFEIYQRVPKKVWRTSHRRCSIKQGVPNAINVFKVIGKDTRTTYNEV